MGSTLGMMAASTTMVLGVASPFQIILNWLGL